MVYLWKTDKHAVMAIKFKLEMMVLVSNKNKQLHYERNTKPLIRSRLMRNTTL